MDDIVERLRKIWDPGYVISCLSAERCEAADEIERLRGLINDYNDAVTAFWANNAEN